MKRLLSIVLQCLGSFLSVFRRLRLDRVVRWSVMMIYTGYKKHLFKSFGNSHINPCSNLILGGNYITIGDGVELGRGLTLTAFANHNEQVFNPSIKIGNGCSIGENAHITICGSLIMGNNVLLGKNVLISDNNHGFLKNAEELCLPPLSRDLAIKGPIIINDNVWIGSKATVLSGVTLGEGCVIAANSVVTKSIPPFSIAAGCPARIIRILQKSI